MIKSLKEETEDAGENAEGILWISSIVHSLRDEVGRKNHVRKNVEGVLRIPSTVHPLRGGIKWIVTYKSAWHWWLSAFLLCLGIFIKMNSR